MILMMWCNHCGYVTKHDPKGVSTYTCAICKKERSVNQVAKVRDVFGGKGRGF